MNIKFLTSKSEDEFIKNKKLLNEEYNLLIFNDSFTYVAVAQADDTNIKELDIRDDKCFGYTFITVMGMILSNNKYKNFYNSFVNDDILKINSNADNIIEKYILSYDSKLSYYDMIDDIKNNFNIIALKNNKNEDIIMIKSFTSNKMSMDINLDNIGVDNLYNIFNFIDTNYQKLSDFCNNFFKEFYE